jgi:hypothetical protein
MYMDTIAQRLAMYDRALATDEVAKLLKMRPGRFGNGYVVADWSPTKFPTNGGLIHRMLWCFGNDVGLESDFTRFHDTHCMRAKRTYSDKRTSQDLAAHRALRRPLLRFA